MAEFSDSPLRRAVALSAVVAEQAAMAVFSGMARRAVELRLGVLKLRRVRCGVGLLHPGDECGELWIGRGGGLLRLLQADLRERDVIHFCRARDAALMFEMAGSTLADVSVKGARLALQEGLVVGVADDAVLCLDALVCGVAGGAVVGEEGVWLRQFAGENHVLPGGG